MLSLSSGLECREDIINFDLSSLSVPELVWLHVYHGKDIYRVFFIESGKVICYKVLKISLSHVVFGLRREVTIGHLMFDHFIMHF